MMRLIIVRYWGGWRLRSAPFWKGVEYAHSGTLAIEPVYCPAQEVNRRGLLFASESLNVGHRFASSRAREPSRSPRQSRCLAVGCLTALRGSAASAATGSAGPSPVRLRLACTVGPHALGRVLGWAAVWPQLQISTWIDQI
jgi:hypothetical protein